MTSNSRLNQTLEYLEAILVKSAATDEETEFPSTIHGLVKKMNAMTGLYWIVCSWKLLEKLISSRQDGMDKKFEKIFFKIFSDKNFPIRVNEDGGLLRSLSAIQLIHILGLGGSHASIISSIGDEAIEFLTDSCTKKKWPFWFDMRSMYCLIGILNLADRMHAVLASERLEWVAEWILSSQAVLGGFGANPNAEPHGGYTFCAISSLRMLGIEIPKKNRLEVWFQARLNPRFNGRPGKPSDSCYVWWICASMINSGCFLEVDKMGVIEGLLNENFFVPETGGFSKYPSIPIAWDESSVHGIQSADLFHTFLTIASLALFEGIRRGNPILDSLTVIPFSSL